MIGDIVIRFAFLLTAFSGTVFLYSRTNRQELRQYARYAYQGSVMMVMAGCAYLLYLILTHQFQYTYVWNYSATTLPGPLLVSTFYAGQEGSFSLWTLYTSVLGLFLLSYTSRRGYENEVMAVWCLIQIFLLTMLVIKSPFAMIWDTFPENLVHTGPMTPGIANAVWLDREAGVWAQYPSEGKGLNPLLQNYWMVIHPQVLFSGFTAMAVPYAFALAGLMRKDYKNWVVTAKPWIVYGAATLGTGIILGGYWAYETLGWGGYWGWDPVENSSLIPWLISISAIHTILAQVKSGAFTRTNFVLAMSCFIAVMYSTFLTRSGVLGETSVHSFVSPGMWAYWFLLGFIVLFAGLGLGMVAYRWKEIPNVRASHTVWSREFALFLGAFTICFAALFITIGTSAPIITTILKGKAAAVDIEFYVRTTLPIGIVIAFLSGIGQLLWWRSSRGMKIGRILIPPLVYAGVFTGAAIYAGVREVGIALLAFGSIFSLIVNLQVGYRVFKGNPRFSGGALAHIGLALLFLGFITSEGYDDTQTVSLEKGKAVTVLGDYTLTYLGSKSVGDERFGFEVKMEHSNAVFPVMPTMHLTDNQTLRHPDVLNMYTRDFYLTPLSVEPAGEGGGNDLQLLKGRPEKAGDLTLTFVDFDFDEDARAKMVTGEGFTIRAMLVVSGASGASDTLALEMLNKGQSVEFVPATTAAAPGMSIALKRIAPNREEQEKSLIEVTVRKEGQGRSEETLVAEASVKPYINLVWLGTITLVTGFIVTIVRRTKESLRLGRAKG